MKRLAFFVIAGLAFSALSNAAQRKIAYERGEKIFVADVDGTHSKKVADGALPEISPDGARVAFNTEGDAKNRPGLRAPHCNRRCRQWQSDGSTKYSERQLFRS